MGAIFHYVGKYMTKWLIVATVVGIGGGICAVVLRNAIDFIIENSTKMPIGIVPFIGAVLLYMLYLIDKKASGFGTNDYIAEVNKKESHFTLKTFFVKLAATAVTLGFKGSGGVAGPMLVIGGSLAKRFYTIPRIKKYLDESDRDLFIICGAAGAIGAILRAPLGGGIFVVELLYRSSLHYTQLFPAMLSSTMGFVIYSMLEDASPLFSSLDYFPSVHNVPFFVLTGILAGVISLLFMAVFRKSRKVFEKIPTLFGKLIIGAVATSVILRVIPEVGGLGVDTIQKMINEQLTIPFLLFLLVGKMVATSITIGAGGSAGFVMPALFVGGAVGNLVAAVVARGEAGLGASLVIAGMAATLASMANVPLAAAIMLLEMVGLRLGIPAILGSIMGYAIGHSQVIYEDLRIEEDIDLKVK